MHTNQRRSGRAKWLPTLLASCAMAVAAVAVAAAQSPDQITLVLKELEAIKQAQAAIQKELGELKALVQARPAAGPAAAPRPTAVGRTVNIAGSPFKGRVDAPLTLVEFSDFQCPFCGRHFAQTVPQIVREYIDTGKLKYVFRHFPLETIHPLALKASEASECANDQNKFWPMHDRLFGNPTMLAAQHLPAHGAAVGLNAATFEQCMTAARHTAKIRRDMAEGQSLGVTGTPAFMLGRTVPGNSTIKVEIFTSGAKAYVGFKQDFDRLLGQLNQ